MREFHNIVEFSFNNKKRAFIVRFLDGTCLCVPTKSLPPRLQLKSAIWNDTIIGKDKQSLEVPVEGRKSLVIFAHMLYSSGKHL